MRMIQTLKQLQDLQTETYVYAVIVVLFIVAFALIFAKLIPFQGGNDKSYVKRRVASIVCVIVGATGFFLYNNIYVASYIRQVAFSNQFFKTTIICLAITVIVPIVIGFVIMLVWRHSKFGSMLGKEKNS